MNDQTVVMEKLLFILDEGLHISLKKRELMNNVKDE